MLKMFATQVNGLLQRIADKETFNIEDGARLLAQAAVGDGRIYIKGFNEMKALETEALSGAEPLIYATEWPNKVELMEMDRILLASRYSSDPEIIQIAKELAEKNIPFIAIAGAVASEDEQSLDSMADVFIDTKLIKGLLPDETGNRIAFPSGMAGLYIYHLLKLTLDEILQEDD